MSIMSEYNKGQLTLISSLLKQYEGIYFLLDGIR